MILLKNAWKTWKQIFIFDFSLPTKINLQKSRNNVLDGNAEQRYWRCIQFLNTLLLQHCERLKSHKIILNNYFYWIPKTKYSSKEEEKVFAVLLFTAKE